MLTKICASKFTIVNVLRRVKATFGLIYLFGWRPVLVHILSRALQYVVIDDDDDDGVAIFLPQLLGVRPQ